jgi:hypothetical protein
MFQLFLPAFQTGAQSTEEPLTLLLSVYLFSLLAVVIGLVLTIASIKIRRRVRRKHLSDMAILDDWNSAVRAAYSGNDSEILIALDKLWALSNPITYSEIQPLVRLFLNHDNKNISMRAKKIVDKQLAIVTGEIENQKSGSDSTGILREPLGASELNQPGKPH